LKFAVYIPARFGSTRLPGKPLKKLGEKTLINRVFDQASASGASKIVVATDSIQIKEEVEGFGGFCVLTQPSLRSGSDRVASAIKLVGEDPNEVIVNLQGDEPRMEPEVIAQVARIVAESEEDIVATVCEEMNDYEIENVNVVKVVRSQANRALYFSRAAIPFLMQGNGLKSKKNIYKRHIGLYAYKVRLLEKFVLMSTSVLERLENLEQLRFLDNDVTVIVADAVKQCGFGIDTQEDYARMREQYD